MSEFSRLRPFDVLPPLPEDYALRVLIFDADANRYEILTKVESEGVNLKCSTAENVVLSVSVSRRDKQYELGSYATSPTGMYSMSRTGLFWRRESLSEGASRRYDQVCQDNITNLGRLFRPLRKAIDEGKAFSKPLKDWPEGERNFAGDVYDEYFFAKGAANYSSDADADWTRNKWDTATVVFRQGAWVFTGIDLDNNEKLDIVVAKNGRTNQGVILYGLERAPRAVGEGAPTQILSEAGARARSAKGFTCSNGECCGEVWIPPSESDSGGKTDSQGWLNVSPIHLERGSFKLSYRQALTEPNQHDLEQLYGLPRGKWKGIRALKAEWVSPVSGFLLLGAETVSTKGEKVLQQFKIRFSYLDDTLRFEPNLEIVW